MSAAYRILGGIVAGLLMAAMAVAEPALIRGPDLSNMAPLSRSDALHLRLAGHRPEARPVWMLRYPVTVNATEPTRRPISRPTYLLPEARWDVRRDGPAWTRAAMSAIASHGTVLETIVPADIDRWCPAYRSAGNAQRRAFWVGMMSALAKHESTYRPDAVGGGGLWYGLLQIYPPTARGYGCRARTGEALKNPADNLSCAVRIMAVTVPRDGVVSAGMRGVAADWGPFHSSRKHADMRQWVRQQEYCQPQALMASLRPVARPEPVAATMTLSTMNDG